MTKFKHTISIMILWLLSSGMLMAQGGDGRFITTWKTDNPGTSNDNQITIPTTGSGYDYDITWEEVGNEANNNGSEPQGITGDYTITFPSAGTYRVYVAGDFPRIYFNNEGDKEKILTIENWGSEAWASMEKAFWDCSNLTLVATDAPDLSSTTSLVAMFQGTGLESPDLRGWDVSTITNMLYTFAQAPNFNGDISNWNVSNVENMTGMFWQAESFNQPIGNWDLGKVTRINSMFAEATNFNQPIGGWDVSSVTHTFGMNSMFWRASSFNQNINDWDVSNVKNMQAMFREASSFNNSLNDWDVGSVTTMREMFQSASAFDQDLNDWNVSEVTDMKSMFQGATNFDGNISDWNVAKVITTQLMFGQAASFDQDLSDWDVSGAGTMRGMFMSASSFDRSLGDWDVSGVQDFGFFLNSSGISTTNYDNTLIGWSGLTLQSNEAFEAFGINYCNGAAARQSIIDNFNWTFFDAGQECRDFITTWETTSVSEQITIPTTGSGYDYTVDWGDGAVESNFTGDASHTYTSAGTHTVKISGDFPRIYFNNAGDKAKLLTIGQWGDIEWTSMEFAFAGCENLQILATDAPNLVNATSMRYMFNHCDGLIDEDFSNWDVSSINNMFALFYNADHFNGDISTWDVSNVLNMQAIFGNVRDFNGDISSWDVSNVVGMKDVFFGASAFNQDISNWNTGSAQIMRDMFNGASSFNQDISAWNVSSVTNMIGMFAAASSFNKDLGNWDITAVTDMSNMFNISGLSTTNYDKILQGWAAQSVQGSVTLGASGIDYCQGTTARSTLTGTHSWTINDGIENCNVHIPDANFKAALLANASINTTDDGEITYQEAAAFTGAIALEDSGISDLTGIEAFIELTVLKVGKNSIASLDLSNNTMIVNLDVRENDLTSLDISKLTALKYFTCTLNEITELDFSNNTSLTHLNIQANKLTSVDVSANVNLEALVLYDNEIQSLDLTGLTKLITLSTLRTPITTLDLSSNTALVNVYAHTGSLTSITVGNNTNLDKLHVYKSNLTELDITGAPNIEQLLMQENELQSVNMKSGGNANITLFRADLNPNLTCISVDNPAHSKANWTNVDNPDVFKLSCNPNDIVNIPDANFKAELLANANINTTDDGEITVGEAEAYTGAIVVFAKNVADAAGIEYFSNITIFNFTSNDLTTLDLSNNTKLTFVTVSGNNLTSFDASNNPLLTGLFVSFNNISTLDVSNNPLLTDLLVQENQLTSLDVSHMTSLERLLANDNDITSLDLSNNGSIDEFKINNNPSLSSLDLRNRNPENIFNFDISNNGNLTCVSVDNPAYSKANWTNVDDPAIFKLACDPNEVINFPDANFKAVLTADGNIDTTDDDEITVGEAEAFTGVIQGNLANITDLTGLEYFTNVTQLFLNTNASLETIDVSQNPALEHLEFALCNVSNIDLSNNPALRIIRGRGNNISSIDVSNNPALTEISLYSNNLSAIDVSTATELRKLFLYDNQITTLDLSGLTLLDDIRVEGLSMPTLDLSDSPNLRFLYASGMGLSSLTLSSTNLRIMHIGDNDLTGSMDLSQYPDLTTVGFKNNNFTDIDLRNGNNTAITLFDVTGNANLTCVSVDDVGYSNANWTDKDSQTQFSTDCGNEASDILTFSFAEQANAATINATTHTIDIEVVEGTDLSNLVPTFTISTDASVDPASGVAQDFSSAFTYTITAENPSEVQEWVVTARLPQEAQTITFDAIEDQFLEAGSITLGATASSGLDVSYEVVSGTATLAGNVLSFVELGTITVRATQVGNSEFLVADPVEQSFDVITVTDRVEVAARQLTVYPNPVKDMLYIDHVDGLQKIEVLALNGRVVKLANKASVDLGGVTPGQYLIRITTDQSVLTQKIIKQ